MLDTTVACMEINKNFGTKWYIGKFADFATAKAAEYWNVLKSMTTLAQHGFVGTYIFLLY